MNVSHVLLLYDYEVAGTELDCMAAEVWKIVGVIGTSMTGGSCIKVASAAYKAKIGIKPEFYIAEIGDGACRLD